MARKSRKVDYVNVGNKENLVTEAENQCEKVSHAALYARLSYESEKNRERNTIETQMVLLHNFVKEQKDIVVAKEYYDISKTGTNFERDGFNEMMQDIKEGNIDCVIVKDLSRLGRNYVEAGSYIERVFPFFNVRFISVNDHYDSFRDDISLLISMSNVYNEFYSRDLAKKIRSSYRTSWANGEFPSGQMAYGYEKDKDNPHQLIPDPVAAPVVKKIFQYFIDGMTYAEIARIDFYGQKEIFNLIDEDDNIANQTMSPLVKMIDDKVSADMYSYSDEIDSAILNMQKYSDEFKSNRKKIKELPTIKAEIEKADTILKKFKASGIEESRKDFENIDNKIKNVEKSFASELNAVTVAVASFEEQNRGLDNQMEALDISVENAIELEVIEKLKSINQSLIEILNHKKESVETLKREYEISTTYEKREEIHRKYLNALDEVKNTGGEDINAIQDQLQKNKKRYDDLMSLQNEQGNIEKKIEESIDNFIDKRIELSKKRQAVIDNLKLENISIKVIPLGHLARWKANLQKEFGKEGTFDNDFQNLADKVLSKDNSWEQYRAFLKFMLITDSGNIEKFLNCSTDTRFAKLWTDKYNNDTLSSMIKVLPEDKLQIKIIDENGEIDINEGSPGQKSAAILAFILNSGENPLIIDQPEDDLDNSLIYSLVVKSIRKMKSKRQIIIVTHNPNIPVLGDAEGIIVLERNNQGKVTFRKGKKAGCIEEKLIREGICEIMEGGEDAFRKRERKYQYN